MNPETETKLAKKRFEDLKSAQSRPILLFKRFKMILVHISIQNTQKDR